MTRDIITRVTADITVTLPDGEVITASTADPTAVEPVGIPALADSATDQVTVAGGGAGGGGSVGSNGNGSSADALADLPPELLEPELLAVEATAELPPPTVAWIEASTAAATAVSDALPPEVVALEALVETDSAALAPPDVSDLQPPKRQTRKRK